MDAGGDPPQAKKTTALVGMASIAIAATVFACGKLFHYWAEKFAFATSILTGGCGVWALVLGYLLCMDTHGMFAAFIRSEPGRWVVEVTGFTLSHALLFILIHLPTLLQHGLPSLLSLEERELALVDGCTVISGCFIAIGGLCYAKLLTPAGEHMSIFEFGLDMSMHLALHKLKEERARLNGIIWVCCVYSFCIFMLAVKIYLDVKVTGGRGGIGTGGRSNGNGNGGGNGTGTGGRGNGNGTGGGRGNEAGGGKGNGNGAGGGRGNGNGTGGSWGNGNGTGTGGGGNDDQINIRVDRAKLE